jgi:hypothetical protein
MDRVASAESLVRVLVYAPSPERAAWIDSELANHDAVVQIGFSVGHVVSALVEDPPPRPQILVADFDQIAPGELMHLHVLREQGWFGRIIALGDVPSALRSSLVIEHVLRPPLARDSLRGVITNSTFVAATTRIPVL